MKAKNVNEFYPLKLALSSRYGKFGQYGITPEYRGRFVVYKGFRGAGRLYAAGQRIGYDELLGRLIRIRLKYPLWYDGDRLIMELQRRIRQLETYANYRYIDTDSVTLYN